MGRCRVRVGLLAAVCLWAGGAAAWAQGAPAAPNVPASGARMVEWDIPEISTLPDDEFGRLVRFGRSVLEATYAHVGPAVADPALRFAGNNLACADCHLNDGRKKFGLPLVAADADYPAYSARTARDITLADRVNQCMIRSMNGRPMPADARPMQALLAYLTVLSTHIPDDAKISGAGAGHMPELDRAADPVRGAGIFRAQCADCHGLEGQGVRRNVADAALGYGVPPLWGPDSFNDGAGMSRLMTLANFAHNNMPNGTDWLMPQLSPEDAWDVAAFVESQSRPALAGLERDFPDLLRKPIDAPYGPYADGFSAAQHKYGPYGPIRAEIARLKAEKGSVPNPYFK